MHSRIFVHVDNFLSKYISLFLILFQQGHMFFEETDIFETLKERKVIPQI